MTGKQTKLNDELSNCPPPAAVVCSLIAELLFVIAIFLFLVLTPGAVHCQNRVAEGSSRHKEPVSAAQPESDCFTDHRTNLDFYNSLRIRPIEITEITDSIVQYKFTDRGTIRLFTVNLSARTTLSAAAKTNFEGKRYWLVFCERHSEAHLLEPVAKSK